MIGIAFFRIFVALAFTSKASASNVENQYQEQNVILHDSIDKNIDLLNIQDDFPVYENFKFITQEKTVFVTLEPTTVFITVTKTVDNTVTYFPTTEFETKNTSITAVSPSSAIVETSKPFVTSKYGNSTILPISTKTASTNLVQKELMTTTGELDMILGGRNKVLTEMQSTSSIEASTSVSTLNPITDVTSTTIFDVTPSELFIPTPIESFITTASETSIAEVTFPITSFTVSNPVSSTIIHVSSTSIYKMKEESSSSGKITDSRKLESKTVGFTSSYSSMSNYTSNGLEQLLDNFSPYTDLPKADYDFTNAAVKGLNVDVALLQGTLYAVILIASIGGMALV